MSRSLWTFEQSLETTMMVDASPNQIVAWLKSDENNEKTLAHYGAEWLALDDPKVNAAIALHGKCGDVLDQIFNKSKDNALRQAIAANPHLNWATRDSILDRWLVAKSVRNHDYEVALCLFLNPKITPSAVMDMLASNDRELDVRRKLWAVAYLTMNVRENNGWYEANIHDINFCGLIPWLIRLLCEPSSDTKERNRLSILDFFYPLLNDESLAQRIDFGLFRPSLGFMDIDFEDRSLPTVKDIEGVLSSCGEAEDEYGQENYELSSYTEFFCKLIQLADHQPDWQRSFASSSREELRAAFYKTAPAHIIFRASSQMAHEIDERYFYEKEKLNYKKLPNGKLLTELDELEAENPKITEWMAENPSFYSHPSGRKFLRQLDRYYDHVHQEAKQDTERYKIDRDDRPLTAFDLKEIRKREESVLAGLAVLEEQIRAISNRLDNEEVESGYERNENTKKINRDLTEIRERIILLGITSEQASQGYFVNLVKAFLGLK